jgi:hypothetical protein
MSRPYVIRHTVATVLEEQEVPEGQIEQWLGHGRESTTRRWYIKRRVYRPTYLAAAAAAVEELLLKATMSEAGRAATPPASNPSNLAVRVTGAYQSPSRRKAETP